LPNPLTLVQLLEAFNGEFAFAPYGDNLPARALEIEQAAAYLDDIREREKAEELATQLQSRFSYNRRIQNAFTLVLALQKGAACQRY